MPPKRKAKVGSKAATPIPRSLSELEEVLCAFLGINIPPAQLDTTIRHATTTLKSFIKEPTSVIALFHRIGMKDSRPDTRQLACVLLSKNIAKFWRPLQKSHLNGTSATDATACRENIMSILHSGDAPANLLHSLSYLTATIARLDLPRGRWLTLIDWLLGALGSPNLSHVEASLRILYSVLESSAADKLSPHYSHFYELFRVHITNASTPIIRYRAILALHALIGNIDDEEQINQCLKQSVPALLQSVPLVAQQDDTDSLRSIITIFNSSIALESFVPFALPIFQTLFPLAVDSEIDLNIRDQITTLFTDFVSCHPLLITQPQPLADGSTVLLFDVFFQLAFQLFFEDDDLAFSLEENSAQKCAVKIIEEMFKYLPRDVVFAACVQRFVQYVFSQSPMERKAAYIVLMVCAQSSPIPTFSDSIVEIQGKTGTLLEMGLECGCHALLTETVPIIQQAACLGITYLGEELSPMIQQYNLYKKPLDTVLQVLPNASGKYREHLLMVLDALCETAGANMIPFLPQIMAQLRIQLSFPELSQQESAIAAITSITLSVQEDFAPYFPEIIPIISQILQAPHSEELQPIKQKALIALSAASLAVGAKNWTPDVLEFIHSCIQNSFSLFFESELTDYGLVSANAIFLGNIMAALAQVDKESPATLALLSKTYDCCFRVVRSLAGVHFKNRNLDAPNLNGFDDDDDEPVSTHQDDEEDDEDALFDEDQNYYFDTDSLSAKSAAIASFALLLQTLGPAFQNLQLEQLVDDTSEMLFDDDEDDEATIKPEQLLDSNPTLRLHHVLLEASGYLSDNHLCECFDLLTQSLIHVVLPMAGDIPQVIGTRPVYPEELKRYTLPTVSRLIEAMGVEEDSSIVANASLCLNDLIDKFGAGIVPEGEFTKAMYTALSAIIAEEAPCLQVSESKDQRSDHGEDALEAACQLIGTIIRSLGPVFKIEFLEAESGANLQHLISLCSPERPDTFRAISIGCLAELVEFSGKEHGSQYVLSFLPLIQQFIATATRDVAHNTIFLTCECVKAIEGNQAILSQIDPNVLNTIFQSVATYIRKDYSTASHEDQITHDNAIACAISFTISFPQQFSPQMMFANILSLLPVYTDCEEALKLSLQLSVLFNMAPDLARPFTGRVIAHIAIILHQDWYNLLPQLQACDQLVAFGKQLVISFPQEAATALSFLPPEYAECAQAFSRFQ